MARFLARVEQELQPRLRDRLPDVSILPPEAAQSSLSFDTILGGDATNIIPDRCTVTFNRRLVPSETLDAARRELLEVMEAVQREDPRFEFDYHEHYATEPTMVGKVVPLARLAADVINELGRKPEALVSAGSHDQRFFVRGAGITNTILYGPGSNGQSHQADEYISVDDLVEGTVTLAMILARYLASVPDD